MTFIQTTISAKDDAELQKRIIDLVKRGWQVSTSGVTYREASTRRKEVHWARMKKLYAGRRF
jgi:hypothetical protein